MTSKELKNSNGRKLPPLPPLLYCRIERAAKILECEVEDIIHWAAIGSISLGVHFDNMCGTITSVQNEELKDILISNVGRGLANYRNESKSSLRTIRFGYSKVSFQADIVHEDINPFHRLDVTVSGLWRLPQFMCDNYQYQNLSSGMDMPHPSIFFSTNSEGLKLLFSPIAPIEERITYKDVWIIRDDLERLYNSLIEGGVPKNMYTDSTVAERDNQERLLMSRPHKTPENSLVVSIGLLALVLAEGKNKHKYLNGINVNASQVANEISKMATEVLGKEHSLQISNLRKDINNGINQLKKEI